MSIKVIFRDIGKINEKKNGRRTKIILIEINSLLAEILEQYCKVKEWSRNYFVTNAIEKELIEEFVIIHQCEDYLDDDNKPIDFTLFLSMMTEYIKNDCNNPQIKNVNEIIPDFKTKIRGGKVNGRR